MFGLKIQMKLGLMDKCQILTNRKLRSRLVMRRREMIYEGKSNSILVSGESGAGKTETTKMLMRYLAYLGGRKGTKGRTVEQQVLEDAIFRVVAAIVHLGNIEFAKGLEIDSSILKDDKSKFHLQTIAELLMCDAVALEDALLKQDDMSLLRQ